MVENQGQKRGISTPQTDTLIGKEWVEHCSTKPISKESEVERERSERLAVGSQQSAIGSQQSNEKGGRDWRLAVSSQRLAVASQRFGSVGLGCLAVDGWWSAVGG